MTMTDESRETIEIVLPDLRDFSPVEPSQIKVLVGPVYGIGEEWDGLLHGGGWVLDWFACAGDEVQVGEPLAQLVGVLYAIRVVAPGESVLTEIVAKAGAIAPGAVIARVIRSR